MNLTEQYTEALQALETLGVKGTAPSLRDIEASLTDKQRKYIEKHEGVLVITPALSLEKLIKRFDKKQEIKSYVYKDLWGQ